MWRCVAAGRSSATATKRARLSLPYLPFVEAMRSYVLAREPDGLRKDLGSGAADVARLISEIRDRAPGRAAAAGRSGGRPLAAVAGGERLLAQCVTVQPLLLVLEDLHDAERGTIDLLLHLARNLQGARLLIVGTYRDVEVDRAHPLSGALAELRRSGSFLRVPLRGLTVDEVHRMILHHPRPGGAVEPGRGHPPPDRGQPAVRPGGAALPGGGGARRPRGWALPARPTAPRPASPRACATWSASALSRLSERANQVLSVAAVIGREFRLDVLAAGRGRAREDERDRGAGGGAGAGRDRGARAPVGALRSSASPTRSSVRRSTRRSSPPRRIRWHQQVARALEDGARAAAGRARRGAGRAFAHSSDAEDLKKAVEYAELAARRAMSVYAYGEAVRHWSRRSRPRRCSTRTTSVKRCDLLLALGEAMLPAGADRGGSSRQWRMKRLPWRRRSATRLGRQPPLFSRVKRYSGQATSSSPPSGRRALDTLCGVWVRLSGCTRIGTREWRWCP